MLNMSISISIRVRNGRIELLQKLQMFIFNIYHFKYFVCIVYYYMVSKHQQFKFKYVISFKYFFIYMPLYLYNFYNLHMLIEKKSF